jgi:SAM-dependent methyltransferase
MIERARNRAAAAGLGNAQFLQVDVQIYSFALALFDQVISRTGVMFFGDPTAAFSNIAHALRRSGGLTLLVWQDDDQNPWIGEFVRALTVGTKRQPNPDHESDKISFDRPDQVESLLTGAGFTGIAVEPLFEPISFGPDLETAFRFVRGIGLVRAQLNRLDDSLRLRALDALRQSLAAYATADGVLYPSATWLIVGRRA